MRVQEIYERIERQQFSSVCSACKKFRVGLKIENDAVKMLNNPKFVRFIKMYPDFGKQAMRWGVTNYWKGIHEKSMKFVMPAISLDQFKEKNQKLVFIDFSALSSVPEGDYVFEQSVSVGSTEFNIACYVSWEDEIFTITIVELSKSRIYPTDLQFAYSKETNTAFSFSKGEGKTITTVLGDKQISVNPIGNTVLYTGDESSELFTQRMMEAELVNNSLAALQEYFERVNHTVERSTSERCKNNSNNRHTSGIMLENKSILVPLSSIGVRREGGTRGPLGHERKSPRAHEVRGHLRTYKKSGKTVWIAGYSTGKGKVCGKVDKSILVDTF